MNRTIISLFVLLLFAALIFLVSSQNRDRDLVVYSGRSKALVDPVVQKFREQTGINVEVKYGGSTQLAVALIEEGSRTPADLFWAQDAGALGAVNKAGLLKMLPGKILTSIPPAFRNEQGSWVATTGRARVLAYSTVRMQPELLPGSVFDLTDAAYNGRIAWAPTNASFQSFVSAMILQHGMETTRDWLVGVKNNGAINYANNNAILQGIAAGEADLGITNHYYLLRAKSENPSFPVNQTFFDRGDIGNMLNVAGIAQMRSSDNPAATKFIEFLLSEEIQEWFTSEMFEYPVIHSTSIQLSSGELLDDAPSLNLENLDNLDLTLQLLREVGLL